MDLPALLAEGGFDPEAECAFSLAFPVYLTGEGRAIDQSMHDAIAGRWGQGRGIRLPGAPRPGRSAG